MSKYIGKRIVPKHCGEWNRDIPYEMLSIVLHTESGESYISRCEVPAGMDLMDGRYWAVCSRFSQQIKDMETHLQETESRMNTNLSETETRMAEDLHSTKASMSEELGVTAERLNHTVEATKQTLGQRVDEACEDLAEGEKGNGIYSPAIGSKAGCQCLRIDKAECRLCSRACRPSCHTFWRKLRFSGCCSSE